MDAEPVVYGLEELVSLDEVAPRRAEGAGRGTVPGKGRQSSASAWVRGAAAAIAVSVAPVSAHVGESSATLDRQEIVLRQALAAQVPLSASGDISGEVQKLIAEWREAVSLFSSGGQRYAHPSFRRLVELGQVAIPHIIKAVNERPDDVMVALREITGENPVLAEARGNMKLMRDAWVAWATARNLIAS